MFEVIREFSDLEEVRFAEPSEVGFNNLLLIPDDPHFPFQWGLRNTGQPILGVTGIAGADIGVTVAWDQVRGNPQVIVAVIDTGADLDHEDLQANILPRAGEDWDFADPLDSVPEDDDEVFDGHGTHVSGIVAAVDNAVGVVGVAPGCRIMPLRIDATIGMNQNRGDAINYVAQQATVNPGRRYVINCSWGTNGDHAGVRTAIQNAVTSNIVVVFAAGNSTLDTDVVPVFPGVYPEVIAVAALDKFDRMASFTNFGSSVDVCAPGKDIWSTVRNNNYKYMSGTSMAAPHVAGLAALVWSGDLTLTNTQVRQQIENTCDSLASTHPGFIGKLGRGRINAARAVVPRRRLTFAPDRIEFGSVTIGSPEDRTLTIRNVGVDPVTVSFALSPNPATSAFSWTGTPGVIAPSGTTTVQVHCAPDDVGRVQGQLVVISNAFGSPHSVPLSATGNDPFDPRRAPWGYPNP